jgi:hypothetical protein
VAAGDGAIGVDRLDGEYYASRWYGSQMGVAGTGWLHDMGRGVTYGAVGMGQAIGMKMDLLDRSAEEKKEDAEKDKQQEAALFRLPKLVDSLHSERVLYSAALA